MKFKVSKEVGIPIYEINILKILIAKMFERAAIIIYIQILLQWIEKREYLIGNYLSKIDRRVNIFHMQLSSSCCCNWAKPTAAEG